MSNYTIQASPSFTARDSLATGNANKAISGALFQAEFEAIATAIASKADTSYVDTQVAGVLPSGMIAPYAGSSAPSGWVLCDGSAYDSVANNIYADLYTAIGNTYGGSDGTDFEVPDLRGRVIAGLDNMGSDAGRLTSSGTGAASWTGDPDTLGSTGGSDRHTLTSAQSGLPAHAHSQLNIDYGSNPSGISGSEGRLMLANTGSFSGTRDFGATNNASAANASEAHPVLQHTMVLNYIIKL